MKKYSIILFSLLLVSCVSDPMSETRDEMEIRKSETPEQTIIRQNETIAAIKKQIAEKRSSQQIRLQIPDTCKEINEQYNVALEDIQNLAIYFESFKNILDKNAGKGDCSFCRSKDYQELLVISEKMVNQLEVFSTRKYLELSLVDDIMNDDENRYNKRLRELCLDKDAKDQFDSLGNKFNELGENMSSSSSSRSSLNQVKSALEKIKETCNGYDLNNLKKARQAVQEKYKFIKNNPLLIAAEEECRYKFFGATSKQCSCYTRAYLEGIKNLELETIKAKEQCRVYSDDLAIFRVIGNAKRKCGL